MAKNVEIADELSLGDDFDLDSLLNDDPPAPAPTKRPTVTVALGDDDDPELSLVDRETGEILNRQPADILDDVPFDEPQDTQPETVSKKEDVFAVERDPFESDNDDGDDGDDGDSDSIVEDISDDEIDQAIAELDAAAVAHAAAPKQRRRRRTRAEIEADAARDAALKDASARNGMGSAPTPTASRVAPPPSFEISGDAVIAQTDGRLAEAMLAEAIDRLIRRVGALEARLTALTTAEIRTDTEDLGTPVPAVVRTTLPELRVDAVDVRPTPFIRPVMELRINGDLVGVLEELRGFVEEFGKK